jgi:hypothetical protein
MTIEFPCACGQPLQAQDEHAGQLTRCPKCGREVTIPAGRPAPAAQPPPRPQAVTRRPRSDASHPEEDDEGDRPRRRRPQSSGMSTGCIVLLVLGIVGAVSMVCLVPILIGLLLPAVQKVRQAAERIQDTNNLKQLGLAVISYNDDHGQLPPAVVYDRDGKPLYSWRVLILPYIGEDALYQQFHLDEPWDSPHNKPLLAQMPKVFAQPGMPPQEPYATYYQVFDGPGAAFHSDPGGLRPFDPNAKVGFGVAPPKGGGLALQQGKVARFPADFVDGTSNTILIAEGADPVPWTKPGDLPFTPNGPLPKLGGILHGDFDTVLADGSVHFVRKGVSEETLRAAVTINGGEILGPDW